MLDCSHVVYERSSSSCIFLKGPILFLKSYSLKKKTSMLGIKDDKCSTLHSYAFFFFLNFCPTEVCDQKMQSVIIANQFDRSWGNYFNLICFFFFIMLSSHFYFIVSYWAVQFSRVIKHNLCYMSLLKSFPNQRIPKIQILVNEGC